MCKTWCAAMFFASQFALLTTASAEPVKIVRDGHIEVSIYDLDPDFLNASIEAQLDYFLKHKLGGNHKSLTASEKVQIAKALSEELEKPAGVQMIPYAGFAPKVASLINSSKSSEIPVAYSLPETEFIKGCDLKMFYGDREIGNNLYGSSVYYYQCPNGDLIIENHLLRLMAYTTESPLVS